MKRKTPPQGKRKGKIETPPQGKRKGKIETPVGSPPIDEGSSSVGNKQYCGREAVPWCFPSDELVAKVGLHCYNSHKGTNLQFKTLTKHKISRGTQCYHEMALDAFDPDKKSLCSIQTCVWQACRVADATLLTNQACIEGSKEIGYLWDRNGVDVLYTGGMPKWLYDGALTGSEKLQYYELNESDFLENGWLHLYAEVGAYAKWGEEMLDHLPVKVKKAVVQTKEDVDSSLKLKSRNAIFYLTFETREGVKRKCIIRQTTDGLPQHMGLEVDNVD